MFVPYDMENLDEKTLEQYSHLMTMEGSGSDKFDKPKWG